MHSSNFLTLVDEFFDDNLRPIGRGFARTLGSTPALNVRELRDRYEISATIPGINASEVKVELHEKFLTISHEHSQEKEEKDKEGEMIRQEYSHYGFSRSVALPKNVDEDSIEASASKGVLTIVIKKLPESQPKKVEIKSLD